MIRLSLQLFAKSASYMRAYRKSRAIQKQAIEAPKAESSNRNNQVQQIAPAKTSASSHLIGRLSLDDIRRRETYTLYRVGGERNEIEREFGDRTGDQIRDSVAHEKLKYDKRRGVWVSAKGLKYIIRKKK